MMEATSEAFMHKTKWTRRKSVLLIGIVSFLISIPLAINVELFNNFSDIVTIYIAPFGTVISAITFFWIFGMDNALKEINTGAKKPLGKWFIPLAKYIFCICINNSYYFRCSIWRNWLIVKVSFYFKKYKIKSIIRFVILLSIL